VTATAFKQIKNGAFSTVQAGSTIIGSNSGVSITLGTGHGARFPSPGNGFWITVWNSAVYTDPADDPNMEIMTCTGRSTDTLTVTRGQNGTTASASIAAGAMVRVLLQDQQFGDLHTAVNLLETNYDNEAFGWKPAGVTWTYASATTFTVTGDVTSTYIPGMKLQCTQTTAKYFYVASSSYSSPNTTVTITGGSDYTLANATITNPQYSRIAYPSSFPHWFNFVPTWSGFTPAGVGPAGVYRFKCVERMVFLNFLPTGLGTSNSGTFTFTVPITPANIASSSWLTPMQVFDAGSAQAIAGEVKIDANTLTANAYKDCSGAAFTTTGGKAIRGNILYEI
jgi:hypothetical protein